MKDAVIVSAVRTPVGKAPRGTLSTTRPDELAEGADGDALLAPDHLEQLASSIAADRRQAFSTPPSRPGDTIYLCAVDRARMRVSLMQSQAADFGFFVSKHLLAQPA